MRTLRTVAALLAIAPLLAAAAEHAESACFADAERLCPALRPADPGFLACLVEHSADASPSCRADLAGLERHRSELQRDCGGDALRLCKGVPPGEGRILACLDGNAMLLSPGCAQAIAIAFERVEDMGKACQAELEKHCSGIPRGGGRRFLCLKAKEPLLSERCREALRL